LKKITAQSGMAGKKTHENEKRDHGKFVIGDRAPKQRFELLQIRIELQERGDD